jgi:hypothetical protein
MQNLGCNSIKVDFDFGVTNQQFVFSLALEFSLSLTTFLALVYVSQKFVASKRIFARENFYLYELNFSSAVKLVTKYNKIYNLKLQKIILAHHMI